MVRVSIHAPAWGATLSKQKIGGIMEFQSTRPRGARPSTCSSRSARASFNPRARVGRDYCPAVSVGIIYSFNPRARVGRDADTLPAVR